MPSKNSSRPSRLCGFGISGQAVILTLLFLVLVAGLAAVVVKEVQINIRVARAAEDRLQSEYLTEAGLEIALHQFNYGDWGQRELPIEWDLRNDKSLSGLFEPGETARDRSIRLHVERVPVPERYARMEDRGLRTEGSQAAVANPPAEASPSHPLTASPVHAYPLFRVTSTGQVRNHRFTRTRYLNDASDLVRYVRNVYHFDFDNDRPITEAIVSFGNGGVGVAGFVEQRFRIPPEGRVFQTAAITDSLCAGLVPGLEMLLDENGQTLLRKVEASGIRNPKSEIGSGEYRVYYANGQMQFSPEDAGKDLVVYYDYYHRVPRPPGPFAIPLPYPPMQPNTDQIADALGVTFYRDTARPRIMNHYFPDNNQAVLYFTEHNTAQAMVVDYNFLGSRYTGAIRVNGNLKWSNRDLVYLDTAGGESVEVTGDYQYDPGARVILSNEKGETTEASSVSQQTATTNGQPANTNPRQSTTNHYESSAPYHFPPFLGKSFYRQRSDESSGGSGIYLSNADEMDSLWIQSEPDGTTVREWERASFYRTVGTIVDLSKFDPGDASSVVMAEGNLRLVGTLPQGVKLTVVSGGNLYIEDHITRFPNPKSSSLALIAQQSVCLNLTAPAFANRPPDSYFLRALVWSRQGTFGIIPGHKDSIAEGKRTHFFFMGSVNENLPYSNHEWARAFSSLEWVFDPVLRRPDQRPPWLFTWVSPGGD